MKEKLLKRAYMLLTFSISSVIILIFTTIDYKSKIGDMKSYGEIFINPNYRYWANVIYVCLFIALVTFVMGIISYRKYRKHKND